MVGSLVASAILAVLVVFVFPCLCCVCLKWKGPRAGGHRDGPTTYDF